MYSLTKYEKLYLSIVVINNLFFLVIHKYYLCTHMIYLKNIKTSKHLIINYLCVGTGYKHRVSYSKMTRDNNHKVISNY